MRINVWNAHFEHLISSDDFWRDMNIYIVQKKTFSLGKFSGKLGIQVRKQ